MNPVHRLLRCMRPILAPRGRSGMSALRRCWVISGREMLSPSFSAFDPKRTSPMLFGEYSLHEPRRGRDDIEAFMTDFRKAAPDSNFWTPRT